MTNIELDVTSLGFDMTSTESDVEQKFIIAFLKAKEPYGLGLSDSNFQTKISTRKYSIDKGVSKKIYFPDYVLINGGYPIAIIEAKKPSDLDLDEAFRETRLYAHEINDRCRELNPVKYLMASNGIDLQFGIVGFDKPIICCKVSELTLNSSYLHDIADKIGITGLNRYAKDLNEKLIPHYIKKPRTTIGGKTIQEEEIQKNPLGESISDNYQWIFNPNSEKERQYIVENGYVPTDGNIRIQHEIDRIVKISNSASELIAQKIKKTDKPIEIYDVLSKNSYQQIILLIGKVGVGKSTFIDLLQYTDTIPKAIQETLIWVRLDLNNAPLEKEKIYTWIQEQIITNLQNKFSSEFDFDDLAFLKKLYSVEINSFRKGIGSIYEETSEKFKENLFEVLKKNQNDINVTVRCYIRHLANERSKSVILVFDNCDKKDKDSQLLMFEVANWAKDTLKSIIFLPLRDETYDNYRDQKPLDTAIKQYSFRIESPKFQNVLTRRIQLVLDFISPKMNHLNAKQSEIRLKNDMYVKFNPDNDRSTYLLSMLNSVLNNDNSIRRLLTGLSGGNIRIALEMFLNFCSSGHIPNEEIIKIRNSKDNSYTMPAHIAIRALMRGDRRYYISRFSSIKNLLDAEITDENAPIYLIRLAILRWLRRRVQSDTKRSTNKGYFLVEELTTALDQIGLPRTLVLNQLGYLGKAMCILTENFQYDNITLNTNIKLAPAGYAHLDLLENDITYLATIAEDTRITDENLVNRIKKIITNPDQSFKLTEVCSIASHFVNYIDIVSNNMLNNNQVYSSSDELNQLISMEKPKLTVSKFKSMLHPETNITEQDWLDFCNQYPIGTTMKGCIGNIVSYGIFITLKTKKAPLISGLIHNSNILNKSKSYEKGTEVLVTIIQHDPLSINRISLVFAN